MAELSSRNLALRALNKFDINGAIPQYYLEHVFQRNPEISSRDRALAVHLTNGVLRWRGRLDWIVEQYVKFPFKKIGPDILNILRIALYQLLFMDRIPNSAAVNEAVKQAKSTSSPHIARFVNGILREILRNRDKIQFPNKTREPIRYYSVMYSYPEWLVHKWVNEFGETFASDLLRASNEIPELVVRVNTLKTDRNSLIEKFEKHGISCSPTTFSPVGIRIHEHNGPIGEMEGFEEGLFQVQGEAAQVCSLLLGPSKGELVLEVCAGMGGKASHLAEQVGHKGRVIGLDKNKGSLLRLVDTCDRLGIDWVFPVAADAGMPMNGLFKVRFSKVLVDSPCSGLGVIRRHPDIKWARSQENVAESSRLQARILANSASLLAPGGRLLYVTCTISREENEGVVKTLLESNKGIQLVDLRDEVPEWAVDLVDDEGFFRSFPNVHGMEGFFGAMFMRE